MDFYAAVKAAIHKRLILRQPLQVLHYGEPARTFDLERHNLLANPHNPNGLYMVKDNTHGQQLLNDLLLDIPEVGSRPMYRGIIPEGTILGITREMWRLSRIQNIPPSLYDLHWDYQNTENNILTQPLAESAETYRALLREELAKHCDILVIVNYAWISEWSELVQLKPLPIAWRQVN